MQGLPAFGNCELQTFVPRFMIAIPSSFIAVKSFVPAGSQAQLRARVYSCVRKRMRACGLQLRSLHDWVGYASHAAYDVL